MQIWELLWFGKAGIDAIILQFDRLMWALFCIMFFNKYMWISTKLLTSIKLYSAERPYTYPSNHVLSIFSTVKSFEILRTHHSHKKLARGYCLFYSKTFSLVPDSTECTKFFLPKSAVHYLHHQKSSNIIGQSKTTNTEKHLFMTDFV